MKSLLSKLSDLSLLFKTSIIFFGVITCIMVIKFKPFKLLKTVLLGRHRLQRLLFYRQHDVICGSMILEVYKEIKQSNKVTLTNQELAKDDQSVLGGVLDQTNDDSKEVEDGYF